MIESHPGIFFLGRHGLYIRELDCWIIFLVFKGNDLHSGFASVANPHTQEDLSKEVNMFWDSTDPTCRAAYVGYPNKVLTQRLGPQSVSPSVLFGNGAFQSAHEQLYRNFMEHGFPSIGDFHSFYNRHAREAVFASWNTYITAGIKPTHTPTEMLESLTYVDEQGVTCQMDPAPFNPILDSEQLEWWRGLYKQVYMNSKAYYILQRKVAHKTAQHNLQYGKKQRIEHIRHMPVPFKEGNWFENEDNNQIESFSPQPGGAEPESIDEVDEYLYQVADFSVCQVFPVFLYSYFIALHSDPDQEPT